MSYSYHRMKYPISLKKSRPQAYDPAYFTSVAKRARIIPSTYKKSHGTELLTDGEVETYWQSTGTSPHYLSITLPRQARVYRIEIDVDAEKDATFVPKEIDVYAGTSAHDLVKISTQNIPSKTGTVSLYVAPQARPLGVFELVIKSNHDFGRESRIRKLDIIVEKEGNECAKQLVGQEQFNISHCIHKRR